MREKLMKIPKALKKQILLRYLSGVLNFSISDYKRQYFVV